VENVASEVQNVSTVSSTVSTRTGRVVASEVQVFSGTSAGLSLVPGATSPESQWSIPQAEEVSGGSSEIDVFNPGTVPETVTLRLHLPSGPLAPLTDKVGPDSTWALATNAQTRIPDTETYSAEIDATGGPGVVVGRTVVLPASAASPQAGLAMAVDALSTASPTGEWVVPPPGTSASPAVSGAAPSQLALMNTSSGGEHYSAYAVTSAGDHPIATGTLATSSAVLVPSSVLTAGALDPIMVRASGPMAISEDAGPSGGVGVVTMPGIPLAARIGL
jgi:hypothetical protein